jgi:hypothetical protein
VELSGRKGSDHEHRFPVSAWILTSPFPVDFDFRFAPFMEEPELIGYFIVISFVFEIFFSKFEI